MAKVRDIMSTNVPQVDFGASVFEAVQLMNKKRTTGVVVFQGKRAVGMLTERSLLRRFVPRNKSPSEVKAGDVMSPLLKIGADADTKDATKKIVDNALTRLGVFDDHRFLGWVTVTDLAREAGKKSLVDILLRHNEPGSEETLCPNCRSGVLEKVVNKDGEVLRWECSNCHYSE